MTDNINFKAFKLIATFVRELGDMFGKKYKSIALYSRLIEKTTIVNEKPIQKHINVFKNFCIDNTDSIYEKDINKMNKNLIKYSDRVYIDMKTVLKAGDIDTKNTIWKYLLSISAMLNPTEKARKLIQSLKNSGEESTEAKFLDDIMNKVSDNIEPDVSNPMEAISSIMSSGLFTDLLNGMNDGLNNGSLDLNKLLGTVQGMVSNLNMDDGGGNIGGAEHITIINTMMQNLGGNLSTFASLEAKVEELTEETTED